MAARYESLTERLLHRFAMRIPVDVCGVLQAQLDEMVADLRTARTTHFNVI